MTRATALLVQLQLAAEHSPIGDCDIPEVEELEEIIRYVSDPFHVKPVQAAAWHANQADPQAGKSVEEAADLLGAWIEHTGRTVAEWTGPAVKKLIEVIVADIERKYGKEAAKLFLQALQAVGDLISATEEAAMKLLVEKLGMTKGQATLVLFLVSTIVTAGFGKLAKAFGPIIKSKAGALLERLGGRAGVTARVRAAEGVGGGLARVGARAGKPLPVPESVPWRYAEPGELRGGSLGATSPKGDIVIRRGLAPQIEAETIRHEAVHRFLTPLGEGAITTARQKLGTWFYENSAVARVLEEAIAEGYATRSALRGLALPFQGGYRPFALGLGDAVLAAGAGGTAYLVTRKPEGTR